jgi:hypothetical protein
LSGGSNAFAQTQLTAEEAARIDSTISISLLTCQEGKESYSLYGHTAIRYVNREQGVDVAVNYGIFDMSQSNFVVRFIFGLTDYMMGVQPFNEFCQTYAYERRGVIEQELNLPPEDKMRIVKTIEENYKPENRNYRYNIFYNNCTTKARDVILGPMNVTFKRQADGPSFREMLGECTWMHRWTRFGNDLLLGLKADRPTTVSEQQFLPFNLKDDFDTAVIGDSIPLVKTTREVVPEFKDSIEFPRFKPLSLVIIIGLMIFSVIIIERYFHKNFWWFDALLMLVVGLCGLVLTAMIFSQHPTVNLNLQILLLNPLALIGVYAAFRDRKGGRPHWFWRFYIICLILFAIGSFFQNYAEGMLGLALYLFFKIYGKYKNENEENQQIVNE